MVRIIPTHDVPLNAAADPGLDEEVRFWGLLETKTPGQNEQPEEERLEAARWLYEESQRKVRDIAHALGLTIFTFQALAKERGWQTRAARREKKPLTGQPTKKKLGASLAPSPRSSLPASTRIAGEQAITALSASRRGLVRRIERAVSHRLTLLESRIGDDGSDPEKSARALSTLAKTLRELSDMDESRQKLRSPLPPEEEDPPRTIDALRAALTEKLEALRQARKSRE
jgi:hypothetical protein